MKILRIAPPIFLLLHTACNMPETVQAGNSEVQVEATPLPNAVCNPFGANDPSLGSNYGLISNLWYVPEGARTYNKVADYQINGTKLDATLYFNQLNVPTRPFDQGFQSQDGTILKTPQGNTLYEYFSLHFESVLKLSAHEQPGLYQFALLADDGAVLYVNNTMQGFNKWVDDDGTHASRFACAPQTLNLTYDTRLPIQVDYYQGPRYHIALMLLWRRVADSQAATLQDPACNKEGNGTFFDSTQSPSAPTQTWMDMLARGWHVVAPENYLLPLDSPLNPCNGGQAPPPPS